MPNPIKIIKGVAKVTRGKQKAAKKPGRVINAEGKLATTRGKGMVSEAPLVKGKNSKANVTDRKSIQKALSSDNKKSRYITKKKKEVTWDNRISKHPLIRNAGNASSEIKYRGLMRGKPVPVKKKGK